ncbi:hypothetical protein FOHLNKBM_6213 [Methylobacterium longum]|nr:hypothetical protein FOHLNKBM_6213 [Methylobacterium longum]
MPIDHVAHAPVSWKTLIITTIFVFMIFMVAWMLYLANSGTPAQLSSQ